MHGYSWCTNPKQHFILHALEQASNNLMLAMLLCGRSPHEGYVHVSSGVTFLCSSGKCVNLGGCICEDMVKSPVLLYISHGTRCRAHMGLIDHKNYSARVQGIHYLACPLWHAAQAFGIPVSNSCVFIERTLHLTATIRTMQSVCIISSFTVRTQTN
jgi:hypothetical protein